MARPRIPAGLISLALVLAALPAVPALAGPPSVTFSAPPTSADLEETGTGQPRDLSLPDSRIVLNPLNVLDSATPVAQNTGPDLPLSAGYYVADTAPGLDDLLTVNERPRTTPAAIRPEVAGFSDEFRVDSAWTPSVYTTSTASAGVVTFSDTGSTTYAYGYLTRTVTLNLDAYPILRISVRSAQNAWGLKVNDGSYPSDIVLQNNTGTPGVFDYDVSAITGWHGTKTFYIRMFSIGYQKSVSVDDIRMVSRASSSPSTGFNDEFTSLSSSWTVSAAGSASVSGGSLHLEDPNTSGTWYGYVSRTVSVDVDRYPYLQITVSSAANQWGLKVNDGSYPSDIVVQDDTAGVGTFAYDLTHITGWHGIKSVTIRIFAIGFQQPITVDDVQLAAASAPRQAFRDDFGSTVIDPGWAAGGHTSASTSSGVLHLQNTDAYDTHYGVVSRTVTADVDEFPVVVISVPTVAHTWVLKVNNNTGGADVYLQPATSAFGRFVFDLPHQTGWHGTQRLTFRIFSGGSADPITVDYLYLREAGTTPWLRAATSYTNSWMPHQLPFTASYADGMSLTGRDVFHDVNSVGRSMTLSDPPNDADLQIGGLYRGTPAYDTGSRVLTVTATDYRYAIALPSASSITVSYYPDKDAMLAGGPALAAAGTTSGYWTATLHGLPGATVNIGIGFALAGEAAGTAGTRARAAGSATAAANDPTTQANYWTDFLARVPRPVNFDVQAVPAGTVTPAQVRRMYYRCWVFLQSQVLPAQTEIGYAYQQLATGKPALYLHGAPGAAASASWDSTTGMQFLAYVDPDAAWSALRGLASLVPTSGLLPGEFLPSREMQTAWILYQVTGDGSALNGVYPALRRSLIYKMDHPKYGGDTVAGNKDIAFVSSALVDAQYAIEIAQQLGLSADVTDWTSRSAALRGDMYDWFWSSPTATPVQKYDVDTGTRTAGRVMSTTAALHTPGLSGSYVTGLVTRFGELYDTAEPFAGFGDGTNDVRHGITSYTEYGLLEHGQASKAQALANATIRDTVIADMISERYQWDATTAPHGEGERPSLFGALAFIDAVWMNNGYRMDDGVPSFVDLPGAQGGLTGLAIRGYDLDLAVDATAAQVTISGSLVSPGCSTLTVAVGSTVPLAASCSEGY